MRRRVRKSAGLAAAVAVIALAAPAFASASSVTLPAGTLLSPGATINLLSHNTGFETDWGTLECGTVTIDLELVVNNGKIVEAKAPGDGKVSQCFIEGEPFTITGFRIPMLRLTSPVLGELSWKMTALLPGGSQCSSQGQMAVTYAAGTSSIHIDGILAPNERVCGNWHLVGDFAITAGGKAVTLN